MQLKNEAQRLLLDLVNTKFSIYNSVETGNDYSVDKDRHIKDLLNWAYAFVLRSPE